MTWTIRPRSEIGTLSAITAGQGPKVLLLHGVGLQAEAWNKQIDALVARGFSVIAPDMPGHGASPVQSGLSTLDAYTDLVATCLDSPVVAVGHSMGAMIALDLCARYPERVRGVAALNAVFRRTAAAKAAVMARVAKLDVHSQPDPTGPILRWFGDALSAERSACDGWLRAVDPVGYKAAYSVFAAEDGPSVQALEALRIPALFVTGALEENSTPQMSRDMAALAAQGRAEVVAGAAHMMPMTHSDAVSQILTEFMPGCQA